jgi:hypothetical protein
VKGDCESGQHGTLANLLCNGFTDEWCLPLARAMKVDVLKLLFVLIGSVAWFADILFFSEETLNSELRLRRRTDRGTERRSIGEGCHRMLIVLTVIALCVVLAWK